MKAVCCADWRIWSADWCEDYCRPPSGMHGSRAGIRIEAWSESVSDTVHFGECGLRLREQSVLYRRETGNGSARGGGTGTRSGVGLRVSHGTHSGKRKDREGYRGCP